MLHPPVDHAAVAQAQALLDMLRPAIAGEARFDLYSRTLYSTDASIYQVMPVGVVLPRAEEDVHATLSVARDFGVPIIARGGGSSLDGQAIGAGIVLDFSKYMNRLLDVDVEARRARVQPGLVLAELNRSVQPHRLMFGPDPASANRATMGGVIGNNASGSHSILYGMTHDHLQALRVLLADGSAIVAGPLTPEEFQQKRRLAGFEGDIYRLTHRLAQEHRDEILRRYPRHWRSVSGYALNRMINPEGFNLASLLCGSEGTLALTLEATVGLVPRPARTALAIVHFHSLQEAMEATPRLLEVEPSAIELLDDVLLELTRGVPEYARKLSFVEGEPGCLLILEFYGENERELETRLSRLRAHLVRIRAGYATIEARTEAEIANVWAVRKAGMGLLMNTPGDWKPVPFIEDGSVPVEHLAEFVREVRGILDARGVRASFYAHASAGCLHIRPLINLKRPDEVAMMRAIADEWSDLVVRLQGALSGEHGDGRARSEWNEKLFGPTLYRAFCELKDGWDPAGLLNPGNVVRGPRMTDDLRYGPGYHAENPPTLLSFEATGSFPGTLEMCSGMGVCRKTGDGVMCPSYMATREEEHSTRGRANALRAALSGWMPREELLSPRMYEVLDLCLECKACMFECPSRVDMAKIKYEFLYHYYQEQGLPVRNRLFGHIRLLNRLGSVTAPVSNRLARSALARLGQRWLGIAEVRSLPAFAGESFFTWFARHRAHRNAGQRGHVVLFPDTFTLYNYPSMGIATIRVLEAAGYSVLLPDGLRCCGRPHISKGMLGEARELLAYNVSALYPYAMMGLPILGIEPSCLLSFRDEAPELLRSTEARKVAASCLLVDEWLAQRASAGDLDLLKWRGSERELLFHGHCHHKASGIASAVEALNLPPGYRASLVNAGCCGMAGAFGYEVEHYDISQRIAEDRLLPTLRARPEAGIAVSGVSCRQQIDHFLGREAKHLVEWLAADLAE
jgi:FAD/FMN-containing dehydrogenase/Fe-S oxidoreductase